MTKKQAVAFGQTKWWKKLSLADAALFQLHESRLCMPIAVFHEGMEKLLGRPVWTHEFANPDVLIAEHAGKKPAPTINEIMDLIPAEKRIIMVFP